jgi:hypothetical protein
VERIALGGKRTVTALYGIEGSPVWLIRWIPVPVNLQNPLASTCAATSHSGRGTVIAPSLFLAAVALPAMLYVEATAMARMMTHRTTGNALPELAVLTVPPQTP